MPLVVFIPLKFSSPHPTWYRNVYTLRYHVTVRADVIQLRFGAPGTKTVVDLRIRAADLQGLFSTLRRPPMRSGGYGRYAATLVSVSQMRTSAICASAPARIPALTRS